MKDRGVQRMTESDVRALANCQKADLAHLAAQVSEFPSQTLHVYSQENEVSEQIVGLIVELIEREANGYSQALVLTTHGRLMSYEYCGSEKVGEDPLMLTWTNPREMTDEEYVVFGGKALHKLTEVVSSQ